MRQSTKPELHAVLSIVSAFILATAIAGAQDNRQKESAAKESAPDVPDAITVPAGLEPVLFVHASGSQVYTCQADADSKYAWPSGCGRQVHLDAERSRG